jgi:hypothetical protein
VLQKKPKFSERPPLPIHRQAYFTSARMALHYFGGTSQRLGCSFLNTENHAHQARKFLPLDHRGLDAVRGSALPKKEALSVCESCVEIDRRIEQYRQLLPLTLHPSEREHIDRLIAELYRDRVRLHKNPQK